MTETLFQKDSYLRHCSASVTHADERGLQFDQTVFYATAGGQPGDTGTITTSDGNRFDVTGTIKDHDTTEHIHVINGDPTAITVGSVCELDINWQQRFRYMRMHSCMHMLCALIDAPVTGGSIQDGRARLDFDLTETVDKEKLTQALNALIKADHTMSVQWITNEELDAQPELVRTLSAKPPRTSGKIRLVNFDGIDLQPCGGTHVASTAEIGEVIVTKVEKKGRQNRRVIVKFADEV